MKEPKHTMNPNKIARYLNKSPDSFTKKDLIRFIKTHKLEMLNFRYVGGDGRLKTLNFIITSQAQLDSLFSRGERVDGSSLFSYIDAASSDLYVIPRYNTAYLNPFSTIPTIDILCSFYTSTGVRLPSSPENIVRKAHEVLKTQTGLTLEAMAELEYYVLADRTTLYPMTAQSGYHSSAPFTKWETLRHEAMQAIAQTGGRIKYGHTEVGSIDAEDKSLEQHEIEFLPVSIEDAADQIVVAKWILRMLGAKYGVTVSFAPKIVVGHAGSGLHIHSRLVKQGKNMMLDGNKLSANTRKLIAGYLKLAPSLTAFGNTVPISYLRLVPKQEAPTRICWGERNRSVLIRVPLGWLNVKPMIRDTNLPSRQTGLQDKVISSAGIDSQTVEFRCPDGSANIHLLLAGLAVAARHGLEMPDALALADKLYVAGNIYAPAQQKVQENLPSLPTSCWASAENLLRDRSIYEQHNVFSPVVIEGVTQKLKSYKDQGLNERLAGQQEALKNLVAEYLYCS